MLIQVLGYLDVPVFMDVCNLYENATKNVSFEVELAVK